MRLFIRMEDGVPFEHPIIENNFKEAFPDVDLDNLPSWVAPFVRVPIPEVGVYELYIGTTYEVQSGVVTDVHHVRPMTQDEIVAKQNAIKAAWAADGGFASWVFDSLTCSFNPPVPQPQDGHLYYWDESNLKWVQYSVAAVRI